MTTKQKPTGFVAKCQCGSFVAALDMERMERSDVAKMLGDWLSRGDTVEPRFGSWRQTIMPCVCPSTSKAGTP